MKRIALLVLGVAALSVSAFAQSQADIDKALLPAPDNMKAGATVIKWKSDFTYDTLRKGTNRMVCYDRSAFPLQQPVSVECTSIANVDRVAQNLKAEALGDRAKSEASLNELEKNGTRVKPEFGSVWYHVLGPDVDHTHRHMTISVPGATTATLGLPTDAKAGTVWIMNPGTSTAHLMTPGE